MGVREVAAKAMEQVALRGILAVERIQTGATFSPLGDAFIADPYTPYRRLRERDPIHRSRLVGGWVLSRYSDVIEVLRDPRFSSDQRKRPNFEQMRARAIKLGVVDPDEPQTLSMLGLDPPDHTRMRSLVSRAFTPRIVEGLRGRVETIVNEHLDAVADQGGMDVISALAYPLPVTIIAEMLGVPAEDHAKFKYWSDEVIRNLGVSTDDDMRAAGRAARELRAYFADIAAVRRREPREDLLSAMLAAEQEGDRLTAAELYVTCELLLIAGHETTTNLIGNGLLALLQNPEQFEILRRDPDCIEQATEELLRYDSPVQFTARVATEDAAFGGKKIKTGEQVLLVLGAANRDPAQFVDPDRLDVSRAEVRHAGFGHGIHFCLGAPLARLEAPIAFRALIERFPEMKLDPTYRPHYKNNIALRGLEQLPVRF